LDAKKVFPLCFFATSKTTEFKEMCSVGVDTLKASFPQVFELQVWYGLGLHYNTHGKYIVMETLYFLRIFHLPRTIHE